MLHPTVGIFNALISIFGFLLNGYIFLVLVLSKKVSFDFFRLSFKRIHISCLRVTFFFYKVYFFILLTEHVNSKIIMN